SSVFEPNACRDPAAFGFERDLIVAALLQTKARSVFARLFVFSQTDRKRRRVEIAENRLQNGVEKLLIENDGRSSRRRTARCRCFNRHARSFDRFRCSDEKEKSQRAAQQQPDEKTDNYSAHKNLAAKQHESH